MTAPLHATEPYGQHLRGYFQSEVILKYQRYVVSHVRYEKESTGPREVERLDTPGEGHPTLSAAIAAAEACRKYFLDLEAQTRAVELEETDARIWPDPERSCTQSVALAKETVGRNTRIDYRYRDAMNAKHYDFIIVAGVLTEQEQRDLWNAQSEDGFVPEQVGIRPLHRDLQSFACGENHAWHEINGISITGEAPTFPCAASELLARFKATDWNSAASSLERSIPPTPEGL